VCADSGSIDASELRQVFQAQGQSMSQKEVEDLVREVDTDGNMTIEFDEFLSLIASNLKETNLHCEILEVYLFLSRNPTGNRTYIELYTQNSYQKSRHPIRVFLRDPRRLFLPLARSEIQHYNN